MASLDPYDKMNLVDQANHDARRRSMKRVAIISISAVALVAIIAVIAVGVVRGKGSSGDDSSSDQSNNRPSSVKALCANTVYPDSCYATISSATSGSLDPVKIYQLSLHIAMAEVSKASTRLDASKATMDPKYVGALDVCRDLLDRSYNTLNQSMTSTDLTSQGIVDDFKTWLSASITYHDTCLDGFDSAPPEVRSQVGSILINSTQFTSNGLSILTQIAKAVDSVGLRRRLLDYSDDGFPSWLSAKDRKLLQAPDLRAEADIVVAKDGSGKHTSISEALKAVPKKSNKRTVIYVKEGIYKEHVIVDKKMWNVLMIGDGGNATIVTGSLNAVDGVQTFKTASFSAFGQGFIAVSMGFQNTAGAAKHQAVALMSDSDKSVFYKCRFDAFQDTLYPHSLRQFYRECDIVGTVDFIFGNAAVVFQNCTIRPRVPMAKQKDTLTAQGRTDPNQNTGTSFHECCVTSSGDLSDVKVYLGRPWKDYSTTVWMKTYMSAVIDPEGWLAWEGDSGPSTIFYAEYMNTGPGAETSGRVKWKGVHPSISTKTASSYTVDSLIGGGSWLPATGVPFVVNL